MNVSGNIFLNKLLRESELLEKASTTNTDSFLTLEKNFAKLFKSEKLQESIGINFLKENFEIDIHISIDDIFKNKNNSSKDQNFSSFEEAKDYINKRVIYEQVYNITNNYKENFNQSLNLHQQRYRESNYLNDHLSVDVKNTANEEKVQYYDRLIVNSSFDFATKVVNSYYESSDHIIESKEVHDIFDIISSLSNINLTINTGDKYIIGSIDYFETKKFREKDLHIRGINGLPGGDGWEFAYHCIRTGLYKDKTLIETRLRGYKDVRPFAPLITSSSHFDNAEIYREQYMEFIHMSTENAETNDYKKIVLSIVFKRELNEAIYSSPKLDFIDRIWLKLKLSRKFNKKTVDDFDEKYIRSIPGIKDTYSRGQLYLIFGLFKEASEWFSKSNKHIIDDSMILLALHLSLYPECEDFILNRFYFHAKTILYQFSPRFAISFLSKIVYQEQRIKMISRLLVDKNADKELLDSLNGEYSAINRHVVFEEIPICLIEAGNLAYSNDMYMTAAELFLIVKKFDEVGRCLCKELVYCILYSSINLEKISDLISSHNLNFSTKDRTVLKTLNYVARFTYSFKNASYQEALHNIELSRFLPLTETDVDTCIQSFRELDDFVKAILPITVNCLADIYSMYVSDSSSRLLNFDVNLFKIRVQALLKMITKVNLEKIYHLDNSLFHKLSTLISVKKYVQSRSYDAI